MKHLLFSAAAALVLASAPAWADNTVHHVTAHRTVHTTKHTVHHTTKVKRKVNVHRTVHTTHTTHAHPTTWHHTGTVHHVVKRHSTWHGRTYHHPVIHHTGGVHVHINVGRLHANINAPHRYHFGTYHRPSGWYAHRWTYGQRLPRAWFARNYWISNYVTFGLVAPPDGYQWIREGNDAVLVDVDTGEILRVIYNVFY